MQLVLRQYYFQNISVTNISRLKRSVTHIALHRSEVPGSNPQHSKSFSNQIDYFYNTINFI